MDLFDGLILASQIQQHGKINRLNERITAMHQSQEDAAATQRWVEQAKQEVYNFHLRFDQEVADLNRTAGGACYWAYRFLFWANGSGVSAAIFPDFKDKMVFDQVAKRAKAILNYCQKAYFEPQELKQIEYLVFLECGLIDEYRTYAASLQIMEEMRKRPFLYSKLRSYMVAGLAITLMFSGSFISMVGSVVAIVVYRFRKKRSYKLLVNIAQQGGLELPKTIHYFLGQAKVTLEIHTSSVKNRWGSLIELHQTFAEAERYQSHLQQLAHDYRQLYIQAPPILKDAEALPEMNLTAHDLN